MLLRIAEVFFVLLQATLVVSLVRFAAKQTPAHVLSAWPCSLNFLNFPPFRQR
jgi:hypothetical protein